MDRQKLDAELSAAQELIDTTQAAHLSYIAKDGTPRGVPIGFYWTGTEFVLASAPESPKVPALAERPDVALSIEAGGTPGDARTLSIRGRVELTVLDEAVPEYIAAAHKSMEPDAAAEFERHVRKMYPRHVRIALAPSWARYWDFGSGRIPPFLTKLAEQAGEN